MASKDSGALAKVRLRRLGALEAIAADSTASDGDVLQVCNAIGGRLAATKRYSAALPYLRRSVRIFERKHGETVTLARRLKDVAACYVGCGDLEAARDAASRSAVLLADLNGPAAEHARAYALVRRICETLGDRDAAVEAGVFEATVVASYRLDPDARIACEDDDDVVKAFHAFEHGDDDDGAAPARDASDLHDFDLEALYALCGACSVRKGRFDSGFVCCACAHALCGLCAQTSDGLKTLCPECGDLLFGGATDQAGYVRTRGSARGQNVSHLPSGLPGGASLESLRGARTPRGVCEELPTSRDPLGDRASRFDGRRIHGRDETRDRS